MLPKIELPYVVVQTPYPGASPEKVEAAVTSPLEELVGQISGLRKITSVSAENVSQIVMEFSYDTEINTVILDLGSMLEGMRDRLPEGAGAPSIMRVSPNMMPLAEISIVVDGADPEETNDIVSAEITPALARVDGISSVEAVGLIQSRVEIQLNQGKIDELNSRLLGKVSKKLAETEKGLKSSREKLEKARIQLEGQSASTYEQLEKQRAQNVEQHAQSQAALARVRIELADMAAAKQQIQAALATASLIQKNSLNRQLDSLLEGEAAAKEEARQLEIAAAQYAASLKQTEKAQQDFSKSLSKGESDLYQSQAKLNAAEVQFAQQRDQALSSANVATVISEQISDILAAQNFSMPVGILENGANSFTVKVGAEIQSLEELGKVVLINTGSSGIGEITVSDVADIVETDNSASTYVKVNGQDGVMLEIKKQSDYSSNRASSNLRARIRELEEEHANVHFAFLSDQGSYITVIIESVLNDLLSGGALAIVMLALFLKSIRPTLVIALIIPLSVLLSLVFMYFSGVNLNIMSLAGLSIGIGNMVDNAVVAMENTYRLRAQGLSATAAAIKGTEEVFGPVVASTLTTVSVFIPILFTDGMTKQLFSDMGLTVAYSQIASLLVALAIVPAMSPSILRSQKSRPAPFFERVKDGYARLLGRALRAKPLLLLLCTGAFFGASYLASGMGTGAIPSSDTSEITFSLQSPEDFDREETEEAISSLSSIVQEMAGVDTVGVLYLPPGHKGSVFAVLEKSRANTSQQIASEVLRLSAGLGCEIKLMSSSSMSAFSSGSGLEVQITGSDIDQLREVAAEVASLVAGVDGTASVTNGSETLFDELRISVDKAKATQYNLTVAEIYQAVSSYMSSETESGSISPDKSKSVVIVQPNAGDRTKESMRDISLKVMENGEEKQIPLSEVVMFEDAKSLPVISHEGQRRAITVAAAIKDGYNIGLISRAVEEKLGAFSFPKGCAYKLVGEIEDINGFMGDLFFMLATAFALIFLIMVAQFQSLKGPLIIMFTIPLAFTGAIFALTLLRFELSIISILGFLVLTGIVVDNGIVLVDFANQLWIGGRGKREAIIEACRTRLRPILCTAFTTILGMATIALGVGQGSDMLQPMAIVVFFGLAYGTLMTLFVVPCLYEIFMRKKPLAVAGGSGEESYPLNAPPLPSSPAAPYPAYAEATALSGSAENASNWGHGAQAAPELDFEFGRLDVPEPHAGALHWEAGLKENAPRGAKAGKHAGKRKAMWHKLWTPPKKA
jgi:HAE1 family hydrophobic/amphiphilic exporter-1